MQGHLHWVCMLDMLLGYHQVPLSEESRDITTFIIPYGYFRFKWQYMGMKNPGDVFCHATDDLINKTGDELQNTLPDFGI